MMMMMVMMMMVVMMMMTTVMREWRTLTIITNNDRDGKTMNGSTEAQTNDDAHHRAPNPVPRRL